MLIDRLKGETSPPRQLLVGGELVVRDSTGPARQPTPSKLRLQLDPRPAEGESRRSDRRPRHARRTAAAEAAADRRGNRRDRRRLLGRPPPPQPRGDDPIRNDGCSRRAARSRTSGSRRAPRRADYRACRCSATPTSTRCSRRSPGSAPTDPSPSRSLLRSGAELIEAAQEHDGYVNTYVQVVESGRALRRSGDGPRALLRRPSDPGRRRRHAHGRRPTACSGASRAGSRRSSSSVLPGECDSCPAIPRSRPRSSSCTATTGDDGCSRWRPT